MTPDSLPRPTSSPTGEPSRHTMKIVVVLGVVALLAVVGLVVRGSGGDSSGTTQAPPPGSSPTPTAPKADLTGSTGQAGSDEPMAKAPRFSPTTCWPELERFNEGVTFATFRDWAAPLMASKDPLVLTYLKERLAELIGHDEGRASEVLGWAREASPAEFKLLMAGLRGSEALRLPKVSEQITSLGLDDKLDMGRRIGFLDELQRMPRFEPAQLDRLAAFAKDPASDDAGWITTRAIGRVMNEDYQRTGQFKPYLDKLLTIGTDSLDEHVRYLALEMGMHADVAFDAQGTARLAKVLATEGSEDVRQVAAHDLSMAQDKAQALDIYAKTFAVEKSLCVRWALFRFAARAAGKEALPVMANMAILDPRFQGDYQDFERLYASGIVDFDRIWFGLPSQDPHGCLDHHKD